MLPLYHTSLAALVVIFKEKNVLTKTDTLECDPPYNYCQVLKMLLTIKGKRITIMEQADGGGNSGASYTLFMNTGGEDGDIMSKHEKPKNKSK